MRNHLPASSDVTLETTTYLGEQLTSEPDRVRMTLDGRGEVQNVWVDGVRVGDLDEVTRELGEDEADRIRLHALEACGVWWEGRSE